MKRKGWLYTLALHNENSWDYITHVFIYEEKVLVGDQDFAIVFEHVKSAKDFIKHNLFFLAEEKIEIKLTAFN